MKSTVKHFSGDAELKHVTTLDNRIAAQMGIVGARRADSFSVWIGWDAAGAGRPLRGYEGALPMTRRIFYKSRPSLHECNAKCLNGRHDGACECRCGGKNHGLGQLIPAIS
jgi:hypothetical protein